MSDIVSKTRFTIIFSELDRLLAEDSSLEQIWFCAYEMILRIDELKKCYSEDRKKVLMN